MFKKLTNEEFLQNLKKYNISYIPLEEYKGNRVPLLFRCNVNPEHTFYKKPVDIMRGGFCPYCSHKKAFVGETDIWTKRPDVAKLLLNPDDGYKYFANSAVELDFTCPNCGSIIHKSVNNVSNWGLACPHCGDGRSFGEKFVNELLKQLNVDFIYNKATDWSNSRRYDFIIGNNEIIIEVNGIQHYSRSFKFTGHRNARNLLEEKNNDIMKKTLALNNGVKHYIVLDCRNSDYEFVKQSILESKLSQLFDLTNIDWEKCLEATDISNVSICANLWNSGMKNTKEISEKISMDRTSVIGYLKKAKALGLCDYDIHYTRNINLSNVIEIWNEQTKNLKEISLMLGLSYSYVNQLLLLAQEKGLCDYQRSFPHKHRSKTRRIICVETQKVYNSISSVESDGYDRRGVNNCLGGWAKSAYGKHWEYVD